MTIGLIVECGPEGPDEKVCRHFIGRLDASISVETTTMNNKRDLIQGCGEAAAALLASGCEYVVIVWDMNPPWDTGAGTCVVVEREAVFRSIDAADGVSRGDVRLVAVHMMLEAWLASDERAVKAVVERTHSLSYSRPRYPERIVSPKKHLKDAFEGYGGKRHTYNDLVHAIKLAKAMPDLSRVRKCPSFKRFAEKATGQTL